MRLREPLRRIFRGVRHRLTPPPPVALLLGAVVLGIPGALFQPVTTTIPGPRQAVLRSNIPGLELGVNAAWYDFGLNKQAQQQQVAFSPEGIARLPQYQVRTTAWRLALKKLLHPRGHWSACENCHGPNAYASLYRLKDYTPPEKMRLAQNSTSEGDTLFFDVSLLVDETQFEERPLQIRDLDALMAEVRALIAIGVMNIPETDFGPELRHLNPVRVERYRDALIAWMGDKVGHSLNPDSTGTPVLNATWMSGTDHPGVGKLERRE